MLILAGVSISILTSDGGFFNKTSTAAETYNNASKDEENQIKNLVNYFDVNSNGSGNETESTPYDTLITPNEITLYDAQNQIQNVQFKTFNESSASGTLNITDEGLKYDSYANSTLRWERTFTIADNIELLNQQFNSKIKINVTEITGECYFCYNTFGTFYSNLNDDAIKISEIGEYEINLTNFNENTYVTFGFRGNNSSNITIDKITLTQFPYTNKDVIATVSNVKSTTAKVDVPESFVSSIGEVVEYKYCIKDADTEKILLSTSPFNEYTNLEPKTTYEVRVSARTLDNKVYISDKVSFTTENNILYLYNRGKEYTDTTGEFVTFHEANGIIDITRNKSDILYSSTATSTNSNYRGIYKSFNSENEYNKLCINITSFSGTQLYFGIGSLVTNYETYTKFLNCTAPGSYYLDISDVTTIDKIFISARTDSANKLTFDKVWLEK